MVAPPLVVCVVVGRQHLTLVVSPRGILRRDAYDGQKEQAHENTHCDCACAGDVAVDFGIAFGCTTRLPFDSDPTILRGSTISFVNIW